MDSGAKGNCPASKRRFGISKSGIAGVGGRVVKSLERVCSINHIVLFKPEWLPPFSNDLSSKDLGLQYTMVSMASSSGDNPYNYFSRDRHSPGLSGE